MSIHASRPLPPRKTSHPDVVSPPVAPPASALPASAIPPQRAETPAAVDLALPSRPADLPSPAPARSADAVDAGAGPWYRQEPWLAAMALAFVFVVAAIWAPQAAKYPLIGAGAGCMVVGLALLVRAGRPAARGRATHV